MQIKSLTLTIFIFTLLFNLSKAQNNTSHRPDGHAPISIMGDHYHNKGELMFSYRYMPMHMSGALKDGNVVSDDQIIQKGFMSSPKKMQMDMHMIGFMYAPSDNITFMIMGNYISNSMRLKKLKTCHGMKKDTKFSTQSRGLGDMSLSAMLKIFKNNIHSIHANMGISIPTGGINQKGKPMGKEITLAYPMQLGSGTWDPMVGFTYFGKSEKISWGIQPKYKFRLYKNPQNYKLGNRFDAVGWLSTKISDYLSFSGSVSYFNIQQISGKDSSMKTMMMPLFNSKNSGLSQIETGIGSNILIPKGKLKNLRIGLEIKVPVYQKVNGIQMKNITTAVFGIQYTI